MNNRINIPLVFAILIPIAMIIFIASSIYLPSLFIKPQSSFIYSTESYNASYRYEVVNKRLEKVIFSDNYSYSPSQYPPTLFFHDVTSNKSREITFEEAQSLNINPSQKSDDGFEIVDGSYSSGLFGFSTSYGTYFLKKGSYSKKLNLNTAGNYYGFKFLGWVN